jgi:hypothetical protein
MAIPYFRVAILPNKYKQLIHIRTNTPVVQLHIRFWSRYTAMSDCQTRCRDYCTTATDCSTLSTSSTSSSMSPGECISQCSFFDDAQCEAFMKTVPSPCDSASTSASASARASSSTSTFSTSTAAFSNKSGKQSSSQGSCSL